MRLSKSDVRSRNVVQWLGCGKIQKRKCQKYVLLNHMDNQFNRWLIETKVLSVSRKKEYKEKAFLRFLGEQSQARVTHSALLAVRDPRLPPLS